VPYVKIEVQIVDMEGLDDLKKYNIILKKKKISQGTL